MHVGHEDGQNGRLSPRMRGSTTYEITEDAGKGKGVKDPTTSRNLANRPTKVDSQSSNLTDSSRLCNYGYKRASCGVCKMGWAQKMQNQLDEAAPWSSEDDLRGREIRGQSGPSPSGHRGWSRNFKTTLCLFFLQGNCKEGNNCSFAHGVDELRTTLETPGQSEPNPSSQNGTVEQMQHVPAILPIKDTGIFKLANIPCSCLLQGLVQVLNSRGFSGYYDMIFYPKDFTRPRVRAKPMVLNGTTVQNILTPLTFYGVGYAIISFRGQASRFSSDFEGYEFSSSKKAQILRATDNTLN
jgi:hypothetical protein